MKGGLQYVVLSCFFWWVLCCRHVLIKKLNQLRASEPGLAQLLVDQVSAAAQDDCTDLGY